MAKSRLIGSYPVIGIRPTIDGRRGALDVRGFILFCSSVRHLLLFCYYHYITYSALFL